MEEHIKELFKQAQNGDKEARDYLIESNMKLVYKIVQRHKKSLDYDTAVQEGTIGLIKAVDKFESDRGLQFSTYAYFKIEGEIKRYYRDYREDRPFRPRRHEYELYKKICKARTVLAQKFNAEPKNHEIAIYLGEDIAEIEMLITAIENYTSLYSTKYSNTQGQEDVLMIDSLIDEVNISEEQIINKMSLEKAIDKLTDTQRKVIQLRYYKNLTQSVVGQVLNISQAQISRIEKKALNILKEAI